MNRVLFFQLSIIIVIIGFILCIMESQFAYIVMLIPVFTIMIGTIIFLKRGERK